jgi:acetyltransferase-like isoleucine patch superfamily enzyme
MPIILTAKLKNALSDLNISTFLNVGATLPDSLMLEPPCSLKWMNIQHSLKMSAFSYAVSGHYFACEIGRYCSIGENVQIGRHSHAMHWVSTSPFFQMEYEKILDMTPPLELSLKPSSDFKKSSNAVTLKRTIIGNDVWIGHGAFIMPGLKIGNGAVIGAMSVVTKDVEAYSVVGGSPAKLLKYRFCQEHIALLENSRWWDYAPPLFKGSTIDDIDLFVKFVEKISEPIYKTEYIDVKKVANETKDREIE